MIYGRLVTSPHSSITEDSVLEFAINSYYDFKMSAADAIMESAGYLLEADDEENKEEKKEEKKDDSSSSSSGEDGFFAKLVAGIKKIFSSFWNAIKNLFEKITGLFKKKADEAASKESKDKSEADPSWYSEKCKFKNYLKVADATEISADPLDDIEKLLDEFIKVFEGNNPKLTEISNMEQEVSKLRKNPFGKSYEDTLKDFDPGKQGIKDAVQEYYNNIPEEDSTYGDVIKMFSRDELLKRNKGLVKERNELSNFEKSTKTRLGSLEISSKKVLKTDARIKSAIAAFSKFTSSVTKILSYYVEAYNAKIHLNVMMFKEIGRVKAEGKAQFEKTDDKK